MLTDLPRHLHGSAVELHLFNSLPFIIHVIFDRYNDLQVNRGNFPAASTVRKRRILPTLRSVLTWSNFISLFNFTYVHFWIVTLNFSLFINSWLSILNSRLNHTKILTYEITYQLIPVRSGWNQLATSRWWRHWFWTVWITHNIECTYLLFELVSCICSPTSVKFYKSLWGFLGDKAWSSGYLHDLVAAIYMICVEASYTI